MGPFLLGFAHRGNDGALVSLPVPSSRDQRQ